MKDHHDALTGIKALSSPQAVDIGCWRRAKQPNATGGLRDERGEKFYFQLLRVTACSCIRWTATHSAEHVLRHAPAVSAMRTRLERPSTEAATGAEKKDSLPHDQVAQLYALASQQIIEPQGLKLPQPLAIGWCGGCVLACSASSMSRLTRSARCRHSGRRRHRLAATYSILCRSGEM